MKEKLADIALKLKDKTPVEAHMLYSYSHDIIDTCNFASKTDQ